MPPGRSGMPIRRVGPARPIKAIASASVDPTPALNACAQAMGSYEQRLECVQIADNGEGDAVQMITLCAGNGGSYDDRLNCLR